MWPLSTITHVGHPNGKANGLFWVAVIMLVVELMFALLLNQVLVTMVSQTSYSKQEEKVAQKNDSKW